MQVMELFRSNPVFGCLDEHELERFVLCGLAREYRQGEYLTHAGDLWPRLFFLRKGSVSAIKESAEGRSLVATTLKAGEVFWGVSFFHPEMPMPVALKAETHCSLQLWTREQVLPFLADNGRMSFELCKLMVSRMLRASEIVEELAFQPVAGRLARLLMDYPGGAGTGPVARSLTLDEMAARIGSTREVVCRFLQRFADDELIKITRTEFEIIDREGLTNMVIKGKG